jgi:hypothetical protein
MHLVGYIYEDYHDARSLEHKSLILYDSDDGVIPRSKVLLEENVVDYQLNNFSLKPSVRLQFYLLDTSSIKFTTEHITVIRSFLIPFPTYREY